MRFCERFTSEQEFVHQLGKTRGVTFWRAMAQSQGRLGLAQVAMEAKWEAARRPYYNVWPTIVPLLLKVDLDFPSTAWRMPKNCDILCIRLPERGCQELPGVRSILFSVETNEKDERVLSLWVDIGEKFSPHPSFSVTVMTFLMCPIDRYATIAEGFADMADCRDSVENADPVILRKCLQLISTLAILDDDPNLIRPDALGKDEAALMEAFRQKNVDKIKLIAERAFRRRGPGWHIGQMYEPGAAYIVPPHPQRYHVGKGRSSVVIKIRKGYEVHGGEFRKVPTGFQHDES